MVLVNTVLTYKFAQKFEQGPLVHFLIFILNLKRKTIVKEEQLTKIKVIVKSNM